MSEIKPELRTSLIWACSFILLWCPATESVSHQSVETSVCFVSGRFLVLNVPVISLLSLTPTLAAICREYAAVWRRSFSRIAPWTIYSGSYWLPQLSYCHLVLCVLFAWHPELPVLATADLVPPGSNRRSLTIWTLPPPQETWKKLPKMRQPRKYQCYSPYIIFRDDGRDHGHAGISQH